MSDEPTYIFKKGEGWIPISDSRFAYGVDARGRNLIIYDRPPKKGEYYFVYKATENQWYDGALIFKAPLDVAKHCTFGPRDEFRDDVVIPDQYLSCAITYV